MNYYEEIIAKATGVESGPDMDEIVFAMGCRFSSMTKQQIARQAKSAWRDVQDARAMFPAPKNVTGTATKALA